MKQFDYMEKWKKLLTPQIVSYLTTIHEYKGKQHLIAERHADVLENLVEIAKIQSTESSNKIEGIYTSADEEYVRELLEEYDVSYIFVGSTEREKYGEQLNEEVLNSVGTVVFRDENYGTYILKVEK